MTRVRWALSEALILIALRSGPLDWSGLMAHTLLKSATLSKALERLEKKGLVERVLLGRKVGWKLSIRQPPTTSKAWGELWTASNYLEDTLELHSLSKDSVIAIARDITKDEGLSVPDQMLEVYLEWFDGVLEDENILPEMFAAIYLEFVKTFITILLARLDRLIKTGSLPQAEEQAYGEMNRHIGKLSAEFERVLRFTIHKAIYLMDILAVYERAKRLGIVEKPVEYRDLWHVSAKLPKGLSRQSIAELFKPMTKQQ